MAFWDELKEMITQGSQEAIQKTKDIAEVMQTNAGISESKRKINELYSELGQMLVKDAFDGTTSEGLAAILSDEKADDDAHEIVLRNWREYYTKVRFIRSEEEVIAIPVNTDEPIDVSQDPDDTEYSFDSFEAYSEFMKRYKLE